MRYLYRRGKGARRRVMHIARFSATGEMLMQALCGSRYPFNASINAPFALGQPTCRRCEKAER